MEKNVNISLDEKRKILFALKLGVLSGSLKNYSLIKKLKKDIARELTKKG